jgi:1-acyl-sn-glycerol-3-phosphate acyltransferase
VKNNSRKIIDVDRLFKVRKGGLLYYPKRLLSYAVKKYIREDEVNALLAAQEHKQGIAWARAVLDALDITVRVSGEEHFRTPGRFVLVGNHPLGALDGLAVIAAAGRHYRSIKSLSHNMLTLLPGAASLIIPINTRGIVSRETVRAIDSLYASQSQVLIFPAGVVSRKRGLAVMDVPWLKTFLTKAVAYERDIIPIYVDARHERKFYAYGGLRRLLQNITGLRLEIFSILKQSLGRRGKTIGLVVGRPIPFGVFSAERSFKTWAQMIREYVYGLKNDPHADFGDFTTACKASDHPEGTP